MHTFYVSVLDKYYSEVAERTRENIVSFYSTLPPPARLTPKSIKRRLDKLAPATRRTCASYIRPLEKELGRDLLTLVKFPKGRRTTIEKGNLYTAEELAKIWANCLHTRDKAMFQVLYEGGLRARELLGLNFQDLKPEKRLFWLTVTGKGSKTRPVPILHAIPALQAWLDVHPTGKGAVFTTIQKPIKRLTYEGLRTTIERILERAGIEGKKRLLHNFRHTRLTELANMGLTEAEMCTFAGWEPGSPMTAVYVHLSGRDLKRSFGRIYGLEQEREEPTLKIEAKVCPRCKKKNPPGARFCSQCSLVLDEELALRLAPEDTSPVDKRTVRALIRDIIAEELGLSEGEGEE